MMSQTWKQVIAMHIMLYISIIKGNQTLKFTQLIGYSKVKFCFEKSYSKCDGETSPRPFSKKIKLNISLDQQSKVLYSFFLLYVHAGHYQHALKLRCRLLAFAS